MKKEKISRIAIWVGLAILVTIVVVTSIILNQKRKKLEELKDKNDAIESENGAVEEENKIFLKNIAIFIDKDIYF